MKTVILAAGFGSRLWPLSTSERPKQFLPLINNQSLLRYTYNELSKTIPTDELYVLTLKGLESQVQTELPDIDLDHILLPPDRRNTLPHTIWALNAIGNDPDEPILFKSADQFILNPEAFTKSLRGCIERYDSSKKLLTLLCSKYESFNANDGYCVADASGVVSKFLEKPNQEELKAYMNNGQLYRNSMLYITTVRAFLEALGEVKEAWGSLAKELLLADSSSRSQLLSDMPFMDMRYGYFSFLDLRRLVVDEIEYAFTDIGRFEEVYALNDKDSYGNVIKGDVILGNDCRNSLIINETSSPLVIMSADNLVAVQSSAGSLISPFKEVSKIGEIYKNEIHGR